MSGLLYLKISLSLTLLLTACRSKTREAESVPVKKDSVVTLNVVTQEPVLNQEGLNTDYYSNGKEKMKGIIKDGQREGLWQAWYENGNLWSEAEYTKGINNGKSTTYFENGKVRYTGKYTNGKKTGEWKYYDEQGKLVKTINN